MLQLRISWTSQLPQIVEYSCTIKKICVKKTTLNNSIYWRKKQKCVLCEPHNEKHIRALWYSADNNRRKTGWQTRKKETKTGMGRWSKRQDQHATIRPDKDSGSAEINENEMRISYRHYITNAIVCNNIQAAIGPNQHWRKGNCNGLDMCRASVLPRPRNYRVRRGFHDNLARFFRVKFFFFFFYLFFFLNYIYISAVLQYWH